jgi:hydrogenase maturation protein HypF
VRGTRSASSSSTAEPGARRRVRARVDGTVQGVGFRPYVHRLAAQLGLDGWVLNDNRGVVCEVEGDPLAVEAFAERLPREAPPLAVVEAVALEDAEADGAPGFRILASPLGADPDAPVAPDAATCEACLAELLDPADRRHRYPFINCTDCGPRFTIVRGVPYDRAQTTMAGFAMCNECRAEYDDPAGRRFHAQANACPECGPSLSVALEEAVGALRRGLVVAVKGLGGYHLACRACDEGAVTALRSRKHRDDKPFALMAADLDAARALVELTADEERLLAGRERPIVIARRLGDAPVAEAVAPGSPDLGVMLPYTPLHHLLCAGVGEPLVMTSGNLTDEPIAYEDAEAARRLDGIADLFVAHDRPIRMRTDDSVVRSLGEGGGPPLILRRSRGYVPAAVALPVDAPPLLACGAELKSAFCLARGRRAWTGHHIGDLRNWETLRSFRDGIEHFQRLFAVEPEVVAHDLHPEYLSTKYALAREGVRAVGVQHHHAHLAAVLAEHGELGPAVGAIYDGTGHGGDGTVWGGELLVGGLGGFERAAHLHPVRLPGGERAIEEPWRMACSWVTALHGSDAPPPPSLAGAVAPERWAQVAQLCRTGLASPVTTSMGRLFDAVAALCGVRAEVGYEGQAAVELEALAAAHDDGSSAYPLALEGGVLDARPTVAAVLADLDAGADPGAVAARFHAAVAAGTADACAQVAGARGLDTAVVSGGVFQNRLLLRRTTAALEAQGLRVLRAERLPPNDGGIAYGQAAVAAVLTA